MKTEPTLKVGPSPYPPLIITYSLLLLYGLGSAVVGIATLDVVAGPAWGLIWPIGIAILSLVALGGVIRSVATERHGWEMVSTLLLVSLLAGYTVAIIWRTATDGNAERLPVAVLPVALSVFPAWRLVAIALGDSPPLSQRAWFRGGDD